MNENNDLLYMSRGPVPLNKKGSMVLANRQVCIYSYHKHLLDKFYSYGKKSKLEKIEDIEILRFIELGINVKMLKMSNKSIPVDHPMDIKKVEKALK